MIVLARKLDPIRRELSKFGAVNKEVLWTGHAPVVRNIRGCRRIGTLDVAAWSLRQDCFRIL